VFKHTVRPGGSGAHKDLVVLTVYVMYCTRLTATSKLTESRPELMNSLFSSEIPQYVGRGLHGAGALTFTLISPHYREKLLLLLFILTDDWSTASPPSFK
jgi:type III secretory pathway component EscV